MQTADRPPTGRERRRKGPINRLRRFLYGLLLLAAAPGAAAIDELAGYGRFRIPPAAAADPAQRPLATVQGLVVLRAQPEHGENMPLLEIETVTARIHDTAAETAPQFLIDAVRTDGGFDVALADVGTLRLDLRVGSIEDSRAWSLDGTLTLARKERKVAEVPAVRIHALHSRETRYLPFEVSVRESQLGFKWRA
jgi:hypothetical protein